MNPHHPLYIKWLAFLLCVIAAGPPDRMPARQNQASVNQSQLGASTPKSPDTSKWKVYRNEKHGFEIAEGDHVAMWNTATGTHRGELFGMPPSGKQISMKDFHFCRFHDGKIVEHWNQVALS